MTSSSTPRSKAACLWMSLLVTAAVPSFGPKSAAARVVNRYDLESSGEDEAADLEQHALELLDREREHRGLEPLDADPHLTLAARSHSREMAAKDYFSHISPTPSRRTPDLRYRRAGGRPENHTRIGENIFTSEPGDAVRAHQTFMDSRAHRRLLLQRDWKRVGIGVHEAPGGRIWVTQMFSD